jgi:hypothetical protein
MDCSDIVFFHPILKMSRIVVEDSPWAKSRCRIGFHNWEGAGYYPRDWARIAYDRFRVSTYSCNDESEINIRAQHTQEFEMMLIHKLLRTGGYEKDLRNPYEDLMVRQRKEREEESKKLRETIEQEKEKLKEILEQQALEMKREDEERGKGKEEKQEEKTEDTSAKSAAEDSTES